MPIYLALDTATDRPSLALGTPEAPGEDRHVASRRDLSREIERVSAELLRARSVGFRDLAGVVVADGPGSFTGLRIGIAFAKGACRAAGARLLAAPSLLGAALAASGGVGSIAVVYDALRGEVYRAVYRFAGDRVTAIAGPELASAAAAAPRSGIPGATADDASAAALIRLVAIRGGAVPILAPDRWEPRYGRLAEAEVRHRARHG